jgi:phosphoribosylaminoimidazole-succinocarboxamide synthase
MSMVSLQHRYSGKVRDIYDAGKGRLLLVASDRISAFDVVMNEPIPDKGRVLTAMSAFWFDQMRDLVGNHLVSTDLSDLPEGARDPQLAGRMMLCREAEMLPVECIVRGYITGSGWKDYQRTGTVSGIPLPDGLRESEQLPEPIFTPSTKAEEGHDETVSLEQAGEILGSSERAEELRDVSIALYTHAAEHARTRGIILADTKFEFGLGGDGRLTLGDEICTPDSSRFWPVEGYEPGRGQPSFDKQYVRDWASESGWDKSPPAPPIPDDVVARTREKYVQAYELVSGESFDAWLAAARA